MSTSDNDGTQSGISPPANTFGFWGDTSSGTGVVGTSNFGYGVLGISPSIGTGVRGSSVSGTGVEGHSDDKPGVSGFSNTNTGVEGSSNDGTGVVGFSKHHVGVYGSSTDGPEDIPAAAIPIGVYGYTLNGHGVHGYSPNDAGVVGVVGESGIAGVVGYSSNPRGFAGYFIGNVHVVGTLSKPMGASKIDHPLDPANKYLLHSGVESPDMKNIYDGVLVLDANGEAIVDLPAWFEVLNSEFRYQLTSIGAPGPNLYIAEEISNQRFKIAGGTPGMKVCWQVTGSRKDAWAQANPLVVEQEKSATERGHYLHPEVYGHSQEQSIAWLHHPGALRRSLEEQQQKTRED